MNNTKTEYPVRNCENCKYCVWRKMRYENGIINDCDQSTKISKLSMEDMLHHIETNTCRFFEEGENRYELDTECYDD